MIKESDIPKTAFNIDTHWLSLCLFEEVVLKCTSPAYVARTVGGAAHTMDPVKTTTSGIVTDLFDLGDGRYNIGLLRWGSGEWTVIGSETIDFIIPASYLDQVLGYPLRSVSGKMARRKPTITSNR